MNDDKYAVVAKSIKKSYKSAGNITNAIKNISLKIPFGEFLMITGRNGSGKSTLMHLMAQLDKPTSGEIFINGEKVSELHESSKMKLRLNSLGYIFQEYALIQELTALENVMLPALMINKFSVAKKRP